MKLLHVGCEGTVDSLTRSCDKCGKKWGVVTFLVTTKELRPLPSYRTGGSEPKVIKIPTKEQFVSKLPNWPRWARLLTVAVILAILLGVILFIRSR